MPPPLTTQKQQDTCEKYPVFCWYPPGVAGGGYPPEELGGYPG